MIIQLTQPFQFNKQQIIKHRASIYIRNMDKFKRITQLNHGVTSAISYGISKAVVAPIETKQGEILHVIQEHDNKLVQGHHDMIISNKTMEILIHHTNLIENSEVMNTMIDLCTRESVRSQHKITEARLTILELLQGRLHPDLISYTDLRKGLKELTLLANKRKQVLSSNSAGELFQQQISFVATTSGLIMILIHIPTYAENSMDLFTYIPTPVYHNTNNYLASERYSLSQHRYPQLH